MADVSTVEYAPAPLTWEVWTLAEGRVAAFVDEEEADTYAARETRSGGQIVVAVPAADSTSKAAGREFRRQQLNEDKTPNRTREEWQLLLHRALVGG